MKIKNKLLKMFLIIFLILVFSNTIIFSQMSDIKIRQLLVGTWQYAFDPEGVLFTSSSLGFDAASNDTKYAVVDNEKIIFEVYIGEDDSEKQIVGPFIISYTINNSKLNFTYKSSNEDDTIYNGVFELIFEGNNKFIGIFIDTDEEGRMPIINKFRMYCVKQD